MRDYGNIQTSFWTHPDIVKLSDQAKLLASYLLSSSHTTMIGCFRVPLGYIAEDLKWNIEVVTSAINELSAIDFLEYDYTTSWVFIRNFLKFHPAENPNQGKCIVKQFNLVPQQLPFYNKIAEMLLLYVKYLDDEVCSSLQTLCKPFLNQNQNQEHNQEQEQNISSGKPDIYRHFNSLNNHSQHSSELKAQSIEILNFLNQKAGKAFQPTDANLKLIMARLKSGATVIDCRQVIAKKHRQWRDDSKMQEYLRPATLFNAEKFDQYRGELVLVDEDAVDADS